MAKPTPMFCILHKRAMRASVAPSHSSLALISKWPQHKQSLLSHWMGLPATQLTDANKLKQHSHYVVLTSSTVSNDTRG